MYRDSDYTTIEKMRPKLTEGFGQLADEVERTVPSTGKFKPLYFSFQDDTESLDIVIWSIRVKDLIYGGCDAEALSKRYIEVVGYLNGGYCITRIIGSGRTEECATLLRSSSFVDKEMQAMIGLLNNCDGL